MPASRWGLARGGPHTPRANCIESVGDRVTDDDPAARSNIASAARQTAQLAELCRTYFRANSDPIHYAIAAWRDSWERPDNSFADAIWTSVANKDTPDFEMQAGAGIETADNASQRQPAARAAAASAAWDDRERARQRASLSGHVSIIRPLVERSSGNQPTAAGEQKTDAPTVRLTATQPLAGAPVRAALSAAILAGIGLTIFLDFEVL
jgi:hypothetical protein